VQIRKRLPSVNKTVHSKDSGTCLAK